MELSKVPILINEQCVRNFPPVPVTRKVQEIGRSNQREQEKFKEKAKTNTLRKVSSTNILLKGNRSRGTSKRIKMSLSNIS